MWRLAWALAACAVVAACGGKAKQSDDDGASSKRSACFALPSGLLGPELGERVGQKLHVELPDSTPLDANADGFVRAQQLVDGLEPVLRGASSRLSRALLHDFIFNQLLNRAKLEGGRAPLPPGLSDSVARAMDDELYRFLERWTIDGQATLAALLTDDEAFVSPELAAHYGITPTPPLWEPVHQPTADRAGVLTLGAFLTRFSSPMARGMQLVEGLGCVTIPPPPLGSTVWVDPARPSAKAVVDSQYGQEPICVTCHQYYVGYGVALDKYDELGRYRDAFAGQPIDTSYYLAIPSANPDAPEATTTRLEFDNPQELGQALSHAPGVRACMVKKLNQVLGGRELSQSELDCVLAQLELENRQASLWSLLAVLSPEYLATAP